MMKNEMHILPCFRLILYDVKCMHAFGGQVYCQKKFLGPAIDKTFKDVNGLIDLLKKIVDIKVSILISASFKDDLGFF